MYLCSMAEGVSTVRLQSSISPLTHMQLLVMFFQRQLLQSACHIAVVVMHLKAEVNTAELGAILCMKPTIVCWEPNT